MSDGLALTGLTKRFGGTVAVDAIDLRIARGGFVSLLGPSGCGKTTTLGLIAGFLTPDAGEIRMGERVLSRGSDVVAPELRNMSMIFQSYAVWPHMTVAQNVAYGLSMRKVPREPARRRVMEALRMVRLDGMAERYPGELSGGQQQRVALARALVVEPQTLLL
ncbi:MAG TPA: ATP-binding cassette domain-containing protein, partial [Methylomirabilota bacterium]